MFASTAREIDELAQAIEEHGFKHTEVLKLHARLPEAQQALVFDTSSRRAPIRIILSTNVAETAVTVPGIRFVIDLGYHRISRYSHRSGVQRALANLGSTGIRAIFLPMAFSGLCDPAF